VSAYSRRLSRAFSLVEAMVVVALIGVIAALAVPRLLPEVQKATLEGGAENVASFIARARAEAVRSKRCVRVFIPSTATFNVVAERLNNFDCDVAPQTLPGGIGIDGTANVWLEFARLRLDSDRLVVSLSQVPSSCNPAPGSSAGTPVGFTGAEIRFRPNGRIFSNDNGAVPARFRNDDAVLTVTHSALGGAGNTKKVLVDGNGLVCVFPRGADPPAGAGGLPNMVCP
jgi:prepilin-type N-terminal cleavage/methylation domain-containing protein